MNGLLLIRVPITVQPPREMMVGGWPPPFLGEAFVPFAESPLAIMRVPIWSEIERKWDQPAHRGWKIAHRKTGFGLKHFEWETADEAMAALMLCDPTYAAWALATGEEGDAATIACRIQFRRVESEAAKPKRVD